MRRKTPSFLLVLLWTGLAATLVSGQVPTEQPPARDDAYRLGPEDVIDVFVWKEPDLSTTVSVRPDGMISLPLTGDIDVRGRTSTELQLKVVERLRNYLADPVVTVIVKEVNSPKVSVLGEVQEPGVFTLRGRMTALDAIALAGGFTEFAKRDEVIILRDGPSGKQRYRLDLKRVVSSDRGIIQYVEPGDTIYVN
jgi:polysaccharide export outer membrane protein